MSGSKAGSSVRESKAGSNANETDNNETVKRKTILTEKALGYKIDHLQKDRKARVNKMKSVISALKELMENDNASQVQTQLDILKHLHEEAIFLHKSLMDIIPEVEQDKQNVWFASINKYNKGFMKDVEKWLSETKTLVSRPATNDNMERLHENKECENPHSLSLHALRLYSNMSPDKGQDELAEKIHELEQDDIPQKTQNIENAPLGVVHDDVQPNDSISNVGSKRYGSKAGTSRTSHSSTSSSCVRAEAEMASLLTRQKLLKKKQGLDQQEEEIRKKKEL